MVKKWRKKRGGRGEKMMEKKKGRSEGREITGY